jgi:hypothetical protein
VFEEIIMYTNTKHPKNLEDVKINSKIKLSTLWIALMFCYTYADILGFYAPGNLEELISGEYGIEVVEVGMTGQYKCSGIQQR